MCLNYALLFDYQVKLAQRSCTTSDLLSKVLYCILHVCKQVCGVVWVSYPQWMIGSVPTEPRQLDTRTLGSLPEKCSLHMADSAGEADKS